MNGKFSIRFLVPMLLTALIGCQKADVTAPATPEEPREPAGLVLTSDFSALIEASSRTNDADDNTINHVALFLVDYLENRLVAYRIIYPDATLSGYDDRNAENGFVNESTGEVDPSLTNGRIVRVTFNYNAPLHGQAERLTRGAYMLLAVANFSESDRFGNSGIARQIQALIDRFRDASETGIEDFRGTCADFYNLILRIPDETDSNNTQYNPYVRPEDVSIPVSCSQEITLISGMNRISAELKHTCARLRIDLHNYSERPLTVKELALSDNFTQSACYLFPRGNNENYDIDALQCTKGAPITSHSNAITPFIPNTVVSREEGVTTLFDGLIYESRDVGNNYTYTIGVNYDSMDDFTRYDLANNGQPVASLTEIQNMGPCFLIRHKSGGFLYVKDDQPYASTDSSLTPETVLDNCEKNNYYYNYVWELEHAYNGQYYLRNVQTEDYIGRITSIDGTRLNMVGKENQASAADIFTVQLISSYEWGQYRSYFAFLSTYYYDQAYINVWQGTSDIIAAWSDADDGSRFELYPVTRIKGLGTTQEVVLRTIDKASGVVSDVHEIQRNDFIRVLVEVSYNPDKGDFEFIVNNWQTGNDEIIFN